MIPENNNVLGRMQFEITNHVLRIFIVSHMVPKSTCKEIAI